MMKILMLNNEFPPLGGGTGTVNLEILKQFSGNPELEIDLITSSADENSSTEQFSDRITIYKIPVDRFNIHHASNKELLLYGWRAFREGHRLHKQNQYDLCFAWSAVPAGVSAYLLKTFSGLPYIVRVSGPDIPGFEERYQSLYPILTPPIKAVWNAAETLVAKCEAEADLIRNVDPRVEVAIIPNGVDTKVFQPGPPVPDDGPLKLLCVARLIKRKGQHHLIQAVKQLADQGVDIALDLVGTGDAEEEYLDLVQSLGVEDRVRLRGYIPREEMPSVYAQAHVFVLPSYNEGMSVATLEAMAAGLPVIVTKTPGTEDLVDDGVNGYLFDFGEIKVLVDQVEGLSNNRSLLKKMGQESRNYSMKHSWNNPSTTYQELFRSKLGNWSESLEINI